MKLKHIGIMALNAIICAGIGYAAYEGHKRNSESAEAIEIRATELAEELAEAEAEKSRVKAERIEQLTCLATNIYYETMAVSLVDAMAVTDVVLNRVDHKKYPTTPCEVVHQSYLNDKGDPLLNKCQFSWYCDGKADEPQNAKAWEKSVRYAADIYHKGNWRGITEGSTHYHATYVNPSWAKAFTKIAQIGAHIFYRQEN